MRFLLFLLALLAVVNVLAAKRALKVLVTAPSMGFSHMAFQGKLADLLVDAGHEVHFLITELNPALNFFNGTTKAQRIIRVQTPSTRLLMTSANVKWDPFAGRNNMLLDGTVTAMNYLVTLSCKDLLSHPTLIDSLKKESYDVVVSEAYDYCLFGIFQHIGIPTRIATNALPLYEPFASILGLPGPSSFVPNLKAPTLSGDSMSYFERVRNAFYNLYQSVHVDRQLPAALTPMLRKKFGRDFPEADRLIANASLMFINANEFFDLARPISHKIIYIGGVVEKQPTTLTPEIEKIFQSAQRGVVMFSLGTITNTSKFPARAKRAFIGAFARFPHIQFVWKFKPSGNDTHLLAAYSNIHVFDWVDQVSILAHPKTKAFITHCGLNSLNEASSHGVPLITVPLFGDQLYNAAIVHKKKLGENLDIATVDEERVFVALRRVLNDPMYAENAQVVKRKLKEAPFRPAEKFVKWVEFAADFPDLSELNLAGADMDFVTYHSLDVIIPIVLVLVAVVWMIVRILRTVLAFLFLSPSLSDSKKRQ